MSNLKRVSVDARSGLAYVQSGIRLGDMALGIYRQGGRALAHGTDPQVGVGGQTSFGGYGFGSRKWGLLLDQVIQAEVVLANGSIVNASATENTELFWVSHPPHWQFSPLRFPDCPEMLSTLDHTRCWTLIWHRNAVDIPDSRSPS